MLTMTATEVDEVQRVWDELGAPSTLRIERGTGTTAGKPYLNSDGALVVGVCAPGVTGLTARSAVYEKILRGYEVSHNETNVHAALCCEHVFNRVMRRLWDSVFPFLPDESSVLDLGSGTGLHYGVLKGKEQQRVIALDYMEQFLLEIDRRYQGRVRTVRCDWNNIYLRDSIGAVIGINALSYTLGKAELERVLRQIDRVLQPGIDGKKRMFFLTDYDPNPEDWYEPGGGEASFDAACKAIEGLSRQAWVKGMAPLRKNARENLLRAFRETLPSLGYDVEILQRTDDNAETLLLPRKTSNLYQKAAFKIDPAINIFSLNAATGISFRRGSRAAVPEGQILESIEYYTIFAESRK